jgi:uncharacterized UBP type Zn finger protein
MGFGTKENTLQKTDNMEMLLFLLNLIRTKIYDDDMIKVYANKFSFLVTNFLNCLLTEHYLASSLTRLCHLGKWEVLNDAY